MDYSLAASRDTPFHLLWLVPLFPLIGATINGLFGKRIQDKMGKSAVHGIAILAMVLAASVAALSFAKLLSLPAGDRFLRDHLFPMISIGGFKVDFAFAIDPLSGLLLIIITFIGTLIHIYSAGYMHSEPAYWRFFCYLNLFVFSMLLLVLGDNFLVMFFGWEGVGLCSYLLIGFWYEDANKAKAGMKAFVTNRVGDFGFITGLFLLFWGLGGTWSADTGQYTRDLSVGQVLMAKRLSPAHEGEHGDAGHEKAGAHPGAQGHGDEHAHGALTNGVDGSGESIAVTVGPTVSFRELRHQLTLENQHGVRPLADAFTSKTVWGIPLAFLICLCFFIGATGKSAQIPLYVWLPDAMAGPTPVSALIHAATMVTAGVYMIARLNFLFALSPGAMTIVTLVGALTALFAATMGFFQYDIKKVLAYSTVSQLGFMFIGVGTGAYWAGVFHLLTHACFKACLFLGSGSVIHGMHFLEHHGHDDHGHDGHGHDAHHQGPTDLRIAPNPQDPQDMRNMGGLRKLMPSTRWTYLLACLTIAGFIPFSAFFSKDEILYKAFTAGSILVPGPFIWLLGTAAALGTSFYMFRSYYMTFWYREPTEAMKANVHESPKAMTAVLWVLAIASVVIGVSIGIPHHAALEHFLAPVFSAAQVTFKEDSSKELVLAVFGGLVVAGTGWLIARALYKDGRTAEARRPAAERSLLHKVLYNKYYVDEIYQATVIRGSVALAKALSFFDGRAVDGMVNGAAAIGRLLGNIGGAIDKYLVDGLVNLVASGLLAGGRQLRRLQTGRVHHYAAAIALGTLALIAMVFMGPK